MHIRGPDRQRGVTLIELVTVIVLLGILGGVALARFVNLADESHDAVAENATGSFRSAIRLAQVQWRAQGGGNSVNLGGGAVSVNPATGRPFAPGGACADLWNGIMQGSEQADPWPLTAGADGWAGVGSPVVCFWVYQEDTTPFRLIRYIATTGAIDYFSI